MVVSPALGMDKSKGRLANVFIGYQKNALFKRVSKMSSYLYFCSVGLRMCISCWELFSQILEKKLSFCCPQILKESSSSLSILACISCIKCRYLSGIKTKKHTKAPVSLCFSALEENNYMKETKRNKTFNQI